MWNKTGKRQRVVRSTLTMLQTVSAFLAVVTVSSLALAEDISVQARVNRHHVPLNGRLQLSLEVNGAQNVQPPDLRLDGFDAQYLGPSTQIAVINGQVSSSISHTYLLAPQQEGTFTIGPIAVTVGGKAYQTSPITVQVLPPASVGAKGGEPSEEAEGESAPQLGDSLQLQLAVEKTRAYLNQAIPVRLQLLVGGVAVRGVEMPTLQADGFLVKPLQQPTQSDVIIGGHSYTLLEFETQAVPLKAGFLSLGPASINCQIVQRRRSRGQSASPFGHDPFEDFFGNDSLLGEFFGSTQLVPITVRADPVTINVLPLPEEGKPRDFAGAIGHFSLDANVIPVEATAGEPITLTMTVKGTGNLDAVTAPSIAGDLSHCKVYEPKPRPDHTTQEPQKIFEQVLIPTDPSVTEIPAVRFSFFDPELGQYRTLTKGPISIHVKPAPVQAPPTIVSAPRGVASQPAQPEPLGRDVIYIKEELGTLRPIAEMWYRSAWWWLLLIAPLILLGISEGLHRYHQRLTADPGLARASGAFKRAIAQCQRAKQLQRSGKTVECAAELFRALQRYIGDRFDLPSEGLTNAELEQHLKPRGIPEELFRELGSLFDRCDAARFAPTSAASSQMSAAVSAAESVLKQLERWKAT